MESGHCRILPPVAVDAPPAPSPDTQILYQYLRALGGISVPHTTATDMGTDWRNSDREAEPVLEIYQGGRQSYVSQALDKGYRLGFVASSDHFSTHISIANAIVADATREGILDAFRQRHVYASTDNIIADVRSGGHMMGDEFTISGAPDIAVKLSGTAPMTREVAFHWKDDAAAAGKTSYYCVRGEQEDGQLVWASPMWIRVKQSFATDPGRPSNNR